MKSLSNIAHVQEQSAEVKKDEKDKETAADRVKKTQLDAQFILRIFCQPLHVLGRI
jgi:hypothetical protein